MPSELAFQQIPAASAEVLRGGLEVIDALADEWRALCESGVHDEPFYRPEWIRAYVHAFAAQREVVIVTARRGARLAAVLPLVRETGSVGGMPARKLRSPSNAHTCRFDLVHGPDGASDVIPAMWAALLRLPGWDVLEMNDVPLRGAAIELVRHAASESYAAKAVRALRPPYLDLARLGDFESLLGRLEAKFRANLRRRMRKLEARGPVALLTTSRVDAHLERFYALERAGWKGMEQSAIACDGPTRAFYDEVARAAERHGYFALCSLESGEKTAAMYYGLKYRGRYYLLKTAYDEALRDCSPGQLLTHEVLRKLMSEGCREFDFLGGAMEWKRDWAPRLRPLADWYVFRGAAGRALHALRFRLRPAVGRAVRRIHRKKQP